MEFSSRFYCRTEAGDSAVESSDPAVPAEYRRVLAVVDGAKHVDVLRAILREHPDWLIAGWLGELEEVGFLRSWPAEAPMELDIAAIPKGEPIVAALVDRSPLRLASDVRSVARTLEESGAYLSLDRLRNYGSLEKTCSEITVLLVEDDPDQLALADLRVSMAGYEVRVAANRQEFIEDIRSHPLPDLVLLDVMLPDGSGFDVLGMIRSHPKLALLRVVLITALTSEQDIRRGIALGADGYVTKPYNKKLISATIRSVLKHS